MPRIPGIRSVVRPATGRSSVDADVDDELQFHLESTAADLVARGMSPEAARTEALRRFGDVAEARSRLRAIDHDGERARVRLERFSAVRLDLRLALRGLRRSPGLVAAVVLTLALGLGANVTMFGIVDRLLLRPPAHVPAPDRIGRLYMTRPLETGGTWTNTYTSHVLLDGVRRGTRTLEGVAGIATPERPLGRGQGARIERIAEVTGEFFPLMRTRALVGRMLAPEDDQPGAPAVAVLAWDTWQRDHGGATTAIGQTLYVGNAPFTIIGVAPRGFTGGQLQPVAAWIPMSSAGYEASLAPEWRTSPYYQWLEMVGRLRDGVTPEQAQADLTAAYDAARPPARRGSAPPVVRLGQLVVERGPDGSTEGRVALLLGCVAVIVLLVSCANVANLLLARSVRREREVAVQLALGAGGGRLVRQLFVESTLLVLLGTVAALGVALAGGRVIARQLLPSLDWDGGALDLRVLAVGSSRVDLQACKLEYSIVSPK